MASSDTDRRFRGSSTNVSRRDDRARARVEALAADPDGVAHELCLRLLSDRPRSRAELERALARRAVPTEAAERVLGRLTEVGLVDDTAFARAWVESRHAGRGLARRALGQELRQRGVDPATAAHGLDLLTDEAERESARALVRRRLAATAQFDPTVRVRRIAAMLARKGYPPGVALEVVRAELAAEAADADARFEGVEELDPDVSEP